MTSRAGQKKIGPWRVSARPVRSLELENILMMTSTKRTENKLPTNLVLLKYVI